MMPIRRQQLVAYGLIDNIIKMSDAERRLMAFLKKLSEPRMVIKHEGSFRVNKADFEMYCHLHKTTVDILAVAGKLATRTLNIKVDGQPYLYVPLFQEIDVSNDELITITFNKSIINALYFLDDTLIHEWAIIDSLPSTELKIAFVKLSGFRKFGKQGVNLNFSDFKYIFSGVDYTQMHELVASINRLTPFKVLFDTPQGVGVCVETGRYGRATLSMEGKS